MTMRRDLVAAARGDKPLDLLITNARLVNVLTGTVDLADIGVLGNRIACVVPAGTYEYSARNTINADGRFVTPGFVDCHVHNESSMITPANFAQAIVPQGTTTVATDPHEIGNVLGLEGVQYMLAASRGLPLRYYVTAPSCVPAVPSVERAGATFQAKEMAEMLSWPGVIAVAEAMDYMGLIHQGGNITPIAEVGHSLGVPIEGHAPDVTGRNLQAYLAAAGPRSSDHESWAAEEMLQKVRAGMVVLARGSTFLDTIHAVAEAVLQVRDTRCFAFCTDDIFAHHLLSMGHLRFGIWRLMQEGVDPVTVIQMATINGAQHFGLHGIGAVAPGWLADILILDGRLEDVKVSDVIVDGQHVVSKGEWILEFGEPVPPLLTNTVNIPPLTEESFYLSFPGIQGKATLNAIDMGVLLTAPATIDVEIDSEGVVQYPLPAGAVMVAIVPRHGQGTVPMMAPAINYPLQSGAIASTVSHDSHNLAVIGTNPRDMLLAAQELQRVGGGFVAVKDGAVVALVELPIAGLMGTGTAQEVGAQVIAFEQAMPQLGLPAAFPLSLIAMALPVFPVVRMTDLVGMVDVSTQQPIPLLAVRL